MIRFLNTISFRICTLYRFKSFGAYIPIPLINYIFFGCFRKHICCQCIANIYVRLIVYLNRLKFITWSCCWFRISSWTSVADKSGIKLHRFCYSLAVKIISFIIFCVICKILRQIPSNKVKPLF